MKKIRNSQTSLAANFGQIQASIPVTSSTLGYYQALEFQFTNQNLLLLINEMKSAGHVKSKDKLSTIVAPESKKKSILRFFDACELLTTSNMINFLNLTDRNSYSVEFDISDAQVMIENEIKNSCLDPDFDKKSMLDLLASDDK